MGDVIALPWVEPGEVRQFGFIAKALIVRREGRRVAVLMHPAVTAREKLVRESFDSADVARTYARRLHAAYPGLYRRVIDETGDAA